MHEDHCVDAALVGQVGGVHVVALEAEANTCVAVGTHQNACCVEEGLAVGILTDVAVQGVGEREEVGVKAVETACCDILVPNRRG